MYKIVRNFFRGGKRTIKLAHTLAEARKHCNDPESSSRTCTKPACTKPAGKRRTRERGPWFDSYTECTR